MSDGNEKELWTPWQIERDRTLDLAMAEMDRKERELLATVEGNGNEYMVVHTLDGQSFLIMTQEARFVGGNDAQGG